MCLSFLKEHPIIELFNNQKKNFLLTQKEKCSCFGNAGDEKNPHPGSRKVF